MHLSWFEVLVIIGLAQGLITSVLLLTAQDKQLGKRILGVTVLVFCIANGRTLLHSAGLWQVPHFRYFPVGMELLLPPLVYLYIASLTEADFKLRPKQLWLLLPGLVYACYDITLYLLTVGLMDIEAKDQLSEALYFNQANFVEDQLIVVMTLLAVFLGFRKILRYLSWLKQFKGHQDFPIHQWLKGILWWGTILGGLLCLNHLLDLLGWWRHTDRWKVFHLFQAFVTYYLGFMGYQQDGLKIHEAQINLDHKSKKMSHSRVSEIQQALLRLFESDQIYLNADLTQKGLAKRLGVTAESLSLVVNQKFELSFRDLVNRYRVEQVKSQMLQFNDRSILDLAMDAGFNSQASFYRAFKKFEGMTPKQFIESKQLT